MFISSPALDWVSISNQHRNEMDTIDYQLIDKKWKDLQSKSDVINPGHLKGTYMFNDSFNVNNNYDYNDNIMKHRKSGAKHSIQSVARYASTCSISPLQT